MVTWPARFPAWFAASIIVPSEMIRSTYHAAATTLLTDMRRLLGVAVLLLVAGCGSAVADDGGGKDGAQKACQDLITARLKSPSSAKFPHVKVDLKKGSKTEYSVVGQVDADNSFGVSIRTNWVCVVRYDGHGHWKQEVLWNSENNS
jgi:hypothetical protein